MCVLVLGPDASARGFREERSRMSQDITEACPWFCLLEMVCVHLKDLFKRVREREREEERVINGSLRVWHRDPIADVCPKQLQWRENESGSTLPALLMSNQPGVRFFKKQQGNNRFLWAQVQISRWLQRVWKKFKKSSAFCNGKFSNWCWKQSISKIKVKNNSR